MFKFVSTHRLLTLQNPDGSILARFEPAGLKLGVLITNDEKLAEKIRSHQWNHVYFQEVNPNGVIRTDESESKVNVGAQTTVRKKKKEL